MGRIVFYIDDIPVTTISGLDDSYVESVRDVVSGAGGQTCLISNMVDDGFFRFSTTTPTGGKLIEVLLDDGEIVKCLYTLNNWLVDISTGDIIKKDFCKGWREYYG